MAAPSPAAPRPMPADPIALTGVGLALPGVEDVAALPDATRGAVRAADPVEPAARIGRRGLRYLDRAAQLALCAGRDALREAGLLAAADGELTVPGESVGVVASSNLGSLGTVCELASAIAERTTDRVSPMALPNASSNVIAAAAAIRFGLRGPNLTFTNGPTSGVDAVFWAALLVTAGRCRHALVIGTETTNPVVARLLGRPECELLDGAVALVVERAGTAGDRGAPRLAELGRYARRPGVCACVERVLADAPAPGIWFPDVRPGGVEGEPVARAVRHDLTAAFGLASGALGVLQCAAAVGWFATGGPDAAAALVTAGADTDDAVSGMLLLRSGREQR